jgi:hypothetical protein
MSNNASDGETTAKFLALDALSEAQEKLELFIKVNEDTAWSLPYIKATAPSGNAEILLTRKFQQNRKPIFVLIMTLLGVTTGLFVVLLMNKKQQLQKK